MKGQVVAGMALVMDRTDNVVTTLDDLDEGQALPVEELKAADGETLTLVDEVPFGHKIALTEISAGAPVYKYGEVIGEASVQIGRGEWVHTHNCDSLRGRGDTAVEGQS